MLCGSGGKINSLTITKVGLKYYTGCGYRRHVVVKYLKRRQTEYTCEITAFTVFINV